MEVSPSHLQFKGDFKAPTTSYVSLQNTLSSPLAFKIKTNAAKVYSVRPNYGVVPVNSSIQVSVTLPTLPSSIPKDFKSTHKFMILSLPSDGLDAYAVQENWVDLQRKYSDVLGTSRISTSYSDSVEPATPKLNGKSQRISKFVPNGSASPSKLAGSTAKLGEAGPAAAIGTATAISLSKSNGSTSLTRSPSVAQSQPQQQPRPAASVSNKSYQQQPSQQQFAPVAAGKDYSIQLDNLVSQQERNTKKIENIERLLIIALMLLSFILGKSMV